MKNRIWTVPAMFIVTMIFAASLFAIDVVRIGTVSGDHFAKQTTLTKKNSPTPAEIVPPPSVRPISLPSSDNAGTLGNGQLPGNVKFINSPDRELLSSTDWTPMTGMELSIKTTAPSRVSLDFSSQINDRVSSDIYAGIVHFRLLRDGAVILSREMNIYERGYYVDNVLPMNFVDNPESGNHIYSVEYSVEFSGFMAYSEGRTLRAIEVNE